jgi:hypothetical protein
LISAALTTDKNPNVLDVTNKVFICPTVDQGTVGFTVADPTGQCWRNVHPDHLTVYDFTPWTRSHPGNSQFRNPIKEFAEAGMSKLNFPSWHEKWIGGRQIKPAFVKLADRGTCLTITSSLQRIVLPAFNAAVGFVPQLANNSPRFQRKCD